MNTAYRVSSTLDATARPPSWGVPRWPTTAVSARTYSGSAMRAPNAGTARAAISRSCGLRSRRRAAVVGSVMSRSAPTDGAFYHLAGVPVMNFLTAPFYLFDEMDALDKGRPGQPGVAHPRDDPHRRLHRRGQRRRAARRGGPGDRLRLIRLAGGRTAGRTLLPMSERPSRVTGKHGESERGPSGPAEVQERGARPESTSSSETTVDVKPRSREVTDGFERAPARAMLRAIGMTDDDWDKPQVGVCSSWNEVTPCNMPLDRLAKRSKAGVRAAG